MARFQNALPLIGLALVASACSSSDDDSSAGVTVEQQMDTARTGYADLMFAMYSDVTDLAIDLQTAIDTFVATPNAANFQAAKDAWLLARPFYQQTEVGRFYDGPIDDADGPEGEINAWPLDENYIDYVSGDPMGMPSGIVNDTAITIDEATLRAANGVGGDANIATGWHAIEFLLWGQDFDVNGPGARPLSDYDGADNNDDRRGAYLSLVAQLLVNDLTSVRDEWAPGTGTYRQTFTSEPVRTSIEKIMTGIATLGVGELRGERILV
ncbi:MAG: imelysin family protein, partial [Planctomycetota bacterium]